jgi:hypothetical protein
MTAATATTSTLDVLSPELALVDPGLADRGRALLREALDPLDRLAAEHARRRLVEAAADAELVETASPSRTRLQGWRALLAG